jgi:hypothetical protein
VDTTALNGSYPLTITGVDGTLTHTTTAQLTVQAAAPPGFTLTPAQGSVTVTRGGAAVPDANTVGRLNGFAGSVALSVSGLPTKVTGSFVPNPVSGSSSTLSFTAARNGPKGTYTVTITGTAAGAPNATTTVRLTVN